MRLFFKILMLSALFAADTYAQNAPDFWSRVSPDGITMPDGAYRTQEPLQFTAFSLNYQLMADYLTAAPREFTAAAREKAFRVVVPVADGKKETFAVVKTRVMAESLEAQHPEIGTYAGESVQTPGKLIRITVTPGWGFRAMVMNVDKGVEYVEPIAEGQHDFYMAYDRIHLPAVVHPGAAPTCGNTSHENPEETFENLEARYSNGTQEPAEKLLGDPVNLRVYRFACSTTGEFSQDVGGTKDLVFQKLTAVTNQLNGIFERDVNNRLELIAQSYDIIFLDPATDPFSGSGADFWMNQNPAAIAGAGIMPSQYDLGHVFGKYVSGTAIGIAFISSCCTGNKARGCSSDYGPAYGDYFTGIAAHEMGHQWSAGHTYNQCTDDALPTVESACEPGSGNSLMSYHGSCLTNDTEGTRFLYYHACTMAQIRHFVAEEAGSTCGTVLPTTNTTPTATAPYPAIVYIPVSTPFELTGSATDPEGDPLTYSWDQIDLGPSVALGNPISSSPSFRWSVPTATPTRTFPKMQFIVANSFSKSEVLPTYNRDINFVFVARDNHAGGGGVHWDTVKLRATTAAGPFLVTYPNAAGVSWNVGGYQTITWDVANTDKSPINADRVNIKLLRVVTGPQFSVTELATLASNVPNNGRHCIQVPDFPGNNLRIRIEAASSVFFDLSDANISIQAASTPALALCPASSVDLHCLPSEYSMEINTAGLGGLTDPILLSAIGLPNGVTASFSPNPVTPGSNSTLSLTFPGGTTESTFDFQVQGSAGLFTNSAPVRLSIVDNDFSAFGLVAPANGAGGVNPQPTLRWSLAVAADKYDVEVATNPAFGASDIVASKFNVVVDTFQVPVVLEDGKVYYWRVRPVNECSPHAWTTPRVFVVAVQSCADFEANDLPKNITANGTPTVESKITINAGSTINDLNITKIQGNHQFFRDLEVRLISPTGTNVLLWKDKCASYNGNFNLGMDDGAPSSFSCPPPNNGAVAKPTEPLSAINGQSAAGTWTLRVKDNAVSSGGSLQGFALRVCSNIALNPPSLITNNPLTLPAGSNAGIGEQLLRVDDADNTPQQLIYTLITLPAHGLLLVNGGSVVVGTQFTQADINSGGLRYYDYGLNQGQDAFDFSVTDGNGGLISGTFVVQPSVGTIQPGLATSFDLAPNPAGSIAVLAFAQPLETDSKVTLYNASGQVVRSWQLSAGVNSHRIELQDVPKGVYAVALENAAQKGVKKLIVQ